jgi:glutathione S-transferase
MSVKITARTGGINKMIKVYGFKRVFGVADPSPFVLKVITFLEIAGLEYELIGDARMLSKAPKRKLPFIDDNGTLVPDSNQIIDYLTTTYQLQLDSGLSQEQLANAHLYTRAMDEFLYFCIVHERWKLGAHWDDLSRSFFGGMPWPLRVIVPKLARKGVIKTLHSQGVGRHSTEELVAMVDEFCLSLSTLLGDKPYFFGREPSSFDATAYAYLACLVICDLADVISAPAKKYPNLVDYCNRFESRYFPSQPGMTTA